MVSHPKQISRYFLSTVLLSTKQQLCLKYNFTAVAMAALSFAKFTMYRHPFVYTYCMYLWPYVFVQLIINIIMLIFHLQALMLFFNSSTEINTIPPQVQCGFQTHLSWVLCVDISFSWVFPKDNHERFTLCNVWWMPQIMVQTQVRETLFCGIYMFPQMCVFFLSRWQTDRQTNKQQIDR